MYIYIYIYAYNYGSGSARVVPNSNDRQIMLPWCLQRRFDKVGYFAGIMGTIISACVAISACADCQKYLS